MADPFLRGQFKNANDDNYHIVSVVVDGNGTKTFHHGKNVVPVDGSQSGLAQHPDTGVQTVHQLVAVAAHFLTQQPRPRRQVQDGDVPVKPQRKECFDTLGVARVVPN